LPVNFRIWPESTAFWIRSIAAFHVASVTFEGSSPLSSITSGGVSPMPFSAVTLPFSFGSSNSWVIEVTGPVSFSFHAMPVIPDCHGSEYVRSGSNGGLFCASIRFPMFGIRSLSSFSTQPLSIIRPRKRSLSVRTMMSRSIELPCDSGRWIFPKYSAFELMSSK
jgi:hypothetical protein